MAVSENTINVFNYLKSVKGADVTAADIAEALGLSKRTVDGVVTSGLQRKGLAVRVPAEVENADGTHTPIKLVKLTEKADNWDFAEEEAKAAAAKAAAKAE